MKRMTVGLFVILFSLSASNVLGQPCEGNFDCDQDVDGTDAAVFKQDFGRSPFSNPCPTCQENPCPCPEACPVSPCDVFGLFPDACLLAGGGPDCCCCQPVGMLGMVGGFCTDFETCLTTPPHPLFGFYDCFQF